MSTKFDQDAFDRAVTYDEKVKVHQQHWRQVLLERELRIHAIQQILQTPWTCGECTMDNPDSGLCQRCHLPRIIE